jgi:uncharacterized protein YbjT (DUF2867 family)
MVRALVHRPEQVGLVRELGAREAVAGDMSSPAILDQGAQGAQAIYHIPPNMSPDEIPVGRAAIEAASRNGVEHFVYHSVLHPQTEAMPHHWQKLRVEEKLFESGLRYTILQPAAYMQNVLAHWDRIVAEGVYPVPYAVDTRLSMVDLEDVGAAAATVLTEPGHEGATYELAGAENLSQSEVAAILSRELGRPVRAESISLQAWEREARAAGVDETKVETLVSMFRYYDAYGFLGNPRVLGWLLRRPPTSFEAFVRRSVMERMGQDLTGSEHTLV